MAINNSRLLSTDPTQVFVSDGQQAITVMYFCNTSAAPANVSVYITSTSDTSSVPTDDSIIYSQVEITASDTYVISTEKLILDDDNSIWVEASVADAVTTTTSSFAI